MVQTKCFVPSCKTPATQIDPLVGNGCPEHHEAWMKSHDRARAMSQVTSFINMKDAEVRNAQTPSKPKAEAKSA